MKGGLIVKYKTISALCRQLALCEMQDRIHEESGRTVFRENEFTEAEMTSVCKIAERTENVLRAGNGLPWASVFEALKKVLPHLFMGFHVQDEIADTCRANRIKFTFLEG